MCTSLMSLFGSIIDQSQEYYSFNDVPLIIIIIMMQADREQV